MILVVDDDVELRSVVRIALEREGFAVDEAGDGDVALKKIAALSPELVVLDLCLPSVGGLEVLRAISTVGRATPPVIALTGLGDETDRIVGLELGADDYVVKPFSPRELVARVRSVLRRAITTPQGSVLEFGDLRVDDADTRGEPGRCPDRVAPTRVRPAQVPVLVTTAGLHARAVAGECVALGAGMAGHCNGQ